MFPSRDSPCAVTHQLSHGMSTLQLLWLQNTTIPSCLRVRLAFPLGLKSVMVTLPFTVRPACSQPRHQAGYRRRSGEHC